jgi:hypothetical protein
MNMYTAYDTLPDPLKDQVEGKIALHDATYTSSGDVRKIYTEFDGNTDPEVAPGACRPPSGNRPKGVVPGAQVRCVRHFGRTGFALVRRPLGALRTGWFQLAAGMACRRFAGLGQSVLHALPGVIR